MADLGPRLSGLGNTVATPGSGAAAQGRTSSANALISPQVPQRPVWRSAYELFYVRWSAALHGSDWHGVVGPSETAGQVSIPEVRLCGSGTDADGVPEGCEPKQGAGIRSANGQASGGNRRRRAHRWPVRNPPSAKTAREPAPSRRGRRSNALSVRQPAPLGGRRRRRYSLVNSTGAGRVQSGDSGAGGRGEGAALWPRDRGGSDVQEGRIMMSVPRGSSRAGRSS